MKKDTIKCNCGVVHKLRIKFNTYGRQYYKCPTINKNYYISRNNPIITQKKKSDE